MLLRLLALTCLLQVPSAQAHQVPNITTEALFRSNGEFALKISLDPRVFLSDQPTSLPPVPAEWFTSQSETEVNETWTAASGYLKRSFELHFDGEVAPLPEADFQPMDGATNEPLSPRTAEVHILATLKGRVPETQGESTGFEIAFGPKANTSLILLNSIDGELERRPQVLFPGETSRTFRVPLPGGSTGGAAPTHPPVTTPSVSASVSPELEIIDREKEAEAFLKRSRWWVLASAVVLAFLLKRVLFPKEVTNG